MKAILLWQPWASLVADERKRIETRSWKAPDWLIRKRIAIHAAKKVDRQLAQTFGYGPNGILCPRGVIVATAYLIAPMRERINKAGVPYVIENVPGAPLIEPFILCGSMFDLKSHRGYLRRHRIFETSFFVLVPSCRHRGLAIGVYGHGSSGLLGQKLRTAPAREAKILMGMDWATRDGMAQAVPPAYSEFIARQFRCEHS